MNTSCLDFLKEKTLLLFISYRVIFILGFILMGCGSVTLWTLVPAHLEEITERRWSSVYMAVYYSANAFGPAIGFLVGKPILSKWVDLGEFPPNSSLGPSDKNWVGAWWLGFLIGGGILLLPSIPLLAFPREFPDTHIRRREKETAKDFAGRDVNLRSDLRSVWPALMRLLKVLCYSLITHKTFLECFFIVIQLCD